MRRYGALILIAWVLLAPRASYSQSVQHDNVEIIDSPASRSSDEKKADLEAVTRGIIDQTNDFREQEGRSRVRVNAKLSEAARDFAQYMARTGRYGHTADGKRPAERASAKGYEYCVIAENIAYAFKSDGFTTEDLEKELVEGWKKSPGHRRNMLDADVTETGVSVARSEKNGYYFAVQMFGRPKSLARTVQTRERVGRGGELPDWGSELQPSAEVYPHPRAVPTGGGDIGAALRGQNRHGESQSGERRRICHRRRRRSFAREECPSQGRRR